MDIKSTKKIKNRKYNSKPSIKHLYKHKSANRLLSALRFAILLLLISNAVYGQQNIQNDTTKVREITIEHSDSMIVNEILYPDVKILIGKVVLKHDSSYMFCDSALYNFSQQTFRAFGNIHVFSPTKNAQDTVHMWGDSLDYRGDEKLAMVRENIILKKDSMMLYTDKLDYNILEDIAYYFDGGTTLNGSDTLVSLLGYYYANKDEIYFRDSVKIYNPKYTINSDTLKHDTKNKISYILGPTRIVSTDTTNSFLYCENGWYNHRTDVAQFNQNALMVHETSTLKGDSLYYDRNRRLGKAFNNVEAVDSTQNALLTGNYGEYHELSEKALLTDSAQFIKIMKNDTLFMHADTLMSVQDSLFTKTDSTRFKLIKAFHKVKIFKSDFQAKCDSLIYTLLDSTFEMHHRPVLWSGKNQISSKFIKAITENNAVKEVRLFDNSLIASVADSIRFNQIKGKNMVVFIDSSKLKRIEVRGNSAAIYFVKEKKKGKKILMGVYKVTSVDMNIIMGKEQVEDIWFYDNPEGTLYPPFSLKDEELKFPNFRWLDNHRPKNREDIFVWIKEEVGDEKTGRIKHDLNAEQAEQEENEKKEKMEQQGR